MLTTKEKLRALILDFGLYNQNIGKIVALQRLNMPGLPPFLSNEEDSAIKYHNEIMQILNEWEAKLKEHGEL
jgi:hypothetical protein